MPHEVSASRTTNPFPEQRGGEHELAPDELDEPEEVQEEPLGAVRPVPVERLLSVAVLTPAQATLMAVQLLDAAHVDGSVDGTHVAVPRVGAVSLTSRGVLGVGSPHATKSTPVHELVRELVQNARRLPAHPRAEQLALLHRLERLADDPSGEPGARARDLEAAMLDTLGPGASQRLAAQLAALADAFSYVAASVPAPPDAFPPKSATPPVGPAASQRVGTSAGSPSAHLAHRAAPARHGAGRPPRRSGALPPRRRGGRAVILLVLLAVVLGVGGYALLSNPDGETVASPGRGPHASGQRRHRHVHHSKPAARERPHTPVVPAVADRHAGPITGVSMQRTGSCAPGALCPVKVTVHFRPASTTQPVTWRVGTAHACRRGITWSAPVTVMAQPGWTTVYASSSVRVPKGRSLALTALTSTPARVQSPPVPVAGSSLRC